ncbi:flagellar biosynthesis protein FlhA [Nitrosovibrio sp. Nv17]|uniref:flagellar biosynthesis protein FlhA n=1 Tax=Nitrosovibrio sp. Nv17 TaxID=1855339 RepID=UPI000908C3A9|nr:flagellar biosynthesis protein FlhA [Nitrosovibrio sp. Nv17]SFW32305.1 flagellar biosynthesis protein FlhA [Nitrosovibrio sp. Nv17]
MSAIFRKGAAFGSMKIHTLASPLLIFMILGMMVLPLPAFLLDMMFTFNIALSIMVLLVGIHTNKPLDFAVFPTVLLLTTLLRLSLNVASTRIVLMEGHNGPDAAGKVIEAFGHYLVGGNYTVGIVVFIILVVINFIVITKGAGRIAEVSARFTLDAMPGKQMAIDADLNAGLIGEEEAGRRRASIAQEAEFYGSMDGASKFVRGDAIAGILILFVNVIGGLVIGVLQHDLDLATAARNYTLLAIGDGLVAQIPALIISTAAGLVVSRVGTDEDTGTQLASQLFSKPQVLILTAAIIGLMGLIPGMPHLAFLLLAALLGGGAHVLRRRAGLARAQASPAPAVQADVQDASWDDVAPVDVLGLEVGYRLVPLVDKGQDGELLRRIKGVRKKFAQEIGYLPPSIHVRDNLDLRPNGYRITLKGAVIGSGEAHPGQYLAIDPGTVQGTLPGLATSDPAFGLPALWIEAERREMAQALGYTVVDAGTVVATHLNHLVRGHSAELLGRMEVQQLLDRVAKDSPKLVEDLVPKQLPLTTVQKVLQGLLEENVHIRDLRTIVDALAEHAPRIQDPHELIALVRVALGRAIVQQIWPQAGELQVMALDSGLERLLTQALQASPDGGGIEPGLADTLLREAFGASQRQEQIGLVPVLLVPASLRTLLARFLRRTVPQLKILSHAEVPDSSNIKVTSILGARA